VVCGRCWKGKAKNTSERRRLARDLVAWRPRAPITRMDDFSIQLLYQHTATMSVVRALPSRAIRPQLSLRYQILRRSESTTANEAQSKSTGSTSPPKGFFRRHRRIAWISTATLGGGLLGSFIFHSIAPPEMPAPGSREDKILMADLTKRIDDEFKVKVLRGKCLGVTKQLRGIEGGWVEVVPRPVEEGSTELKRRRVCWPHSRELKVLESSACSGIAGST
jgi:hypothetical protein